jgi:diguanylate cyclase (GGDEF)-like protein/PAS domain S-box-containing protein
MPLPAVERVLPPALLVTAVVFFVVGPAAFALGDTGTHWWFNMGWTIAPLVAALACFRAAALSNGSDRKAWRDFGLGCALWLAGTLYWEFYDLQGIEAPFPSPADLGYLLTCVFFITGMYHFGSIPRINRVQICNFALLLCAASVSAFLLLYPFIEASELDLAATVIALAHPICWFGTTIFGIVCLLFYVPAEKRGVATLILAGIFAQAAADLFYGLSLLGAEYQVGAFYDSYWIVGFAITTWAATETLWRIRHRPGEQPSVWRQSDWQQLGEALVPVIAVTLVVGSGLVMSVNMLGPLNLVAFPGVLGFIAALAAREQWSLRAERGLRIAAEENSARLAESRERLASVLESTSDSVMVLDRNWYITYANRRAQSLIEGERALKVGRNIWEIYPEAVGTSFERNYRRALATGQPVAFEEYLPVLGKWFEVHATPSQDSITVFFRDVSERRKTGEELAHLAHHDHLTGLYNRLRFGQLLEEALRRATPAEQAAVLYLDLDEFKDVNDTLGHPLGDAVLKTMAERLRACAGERDVIARVGGDEFALIAEGLRSPQDAAFLAERIIASLHDPYEAGGQVLRIGASIGLVICPADGADADELFQKADIALYSAKRDGRGTYRFFDPSMAERVTARQALRSDLAGALRHGELHLAFQSIMDLRGRRICGFEALLRWTHPQRGPIPPASFIRIAEETGLIGEIGDWVLNQACQEASAWPEEINVSVNLSPLQFRNRSLPLRVAAALSASGLSPERLVLEITESVLLHDSEANLAMLKQLREAGIHIALDDFGTGYSSLSYLHRFPFSKLKIDRSFISEVVGRKEAKAIVRAATSLGRALGITITAEGVENGPQLEAISELGCDEAQGYLFSRPVPAAEIPALIETLSSQTLFAAAARPRLVVA